MCALELTEQIQNGIKKYKDSQIVAFLGVAGSGKSVIGAMTTRTLFKSFIPNSNGKWLGVFKSGDEKINDIIRDMKHGKFPSHTLGGKSSNLNIEIHNTKGIPAKFELKLKDMSGENYEKLLAKEYPSINERLDAILSSNADYLAFAKKYVIIIDCAKIDDWDTDVVSVNKMIMNIRKIKKEIHHFDEDEKMNEPIAIIFNKSDLLSKDKQEISVDELANLYNGLRLSLVINVKPDNFTFFKLSVQSTPTFSNQLQVKLPLSYTESEYIKLISWIIDEGAELNIE